MGKQTIVQFLWRRTVPTTWQISTSSKRLCQVGVVGMRFYTSAISEYWNWQMATGYCGKTRTLREIRPANHIFFQSFVLSLSILPGLTLFSCCRKWWKAHFTLCAIVSTCVFFYYFNTRTDIWDSRSTATYAFLSHVHLGVAILWATRYSFALKYNL
jgi:hypothetical protein